MVIFVKLRILLDLDKVEEMLMLKLVMLFVVVVVMDFFLIIRMCKF